MTGPSESFGSSSVNEPEEVILPIAFGEAGSDDLDTLERMEGNELAEETDDQEYIEVYNK